MTRTSTALRALQAELREISFVAEQRATQATAPSVTREQWRALARRIKDRLACVAETLSEDN